MIGGNKYPLGFIRQNFQNKTPRIISGKVSDTSDMRIKSSNFIGDDALRLQAIEQSQATVRSQQPSFYSNQ